MNYGYYPQYPQQFQQYQPMDNLTILRNQQMQPSGDNRIWVQGEVGAKAYLVKNGETVDLWDSESQSIYLKSVSVQGVPTMQKICYTFEAPAPTPAQGEYITRQEFEKRISEIMKGAGDDDE